MKSMAVLALVVVMVAALAVHGSRAQPLPSVSVAMQQCQASGVVPTGAQCRPVAGAVPGALEREYLAESDYDTGDPDWHWENLIARVVVVVASWFAEHFGRVYTPDSPQNLSEAIFDLPR